MTDRVTAEERGPDLQEPGSLEDLYVRTVPGAVRLASLLLGDPELARDIAQEAFLRVAGRFRHLRVPDAFEAYLRRTVINMCTSHHRRSRVEREYLARHRPVTRRWSRQTLASAIGFEPRSAP